MNIQPLNFKLETEEKSIYQYHSFELKSRLIYLLISFLFTLIISFIQMEYFLYLINNLLSIINTKVENTNGTNLELIFTELLEGFFSYLLLSTYIAFCLSIPISFYHLYKFFLPGLSFTEAKILKFFLILSLSFLTLSIFLTYYVILPYAASFFLSFQITYELKSEGLDSLLYQNSQGIKFTGRIYPLLEFIINLLSFSILLFQLPLILFYIFIRNSIYNSTNSKLMNYNNTSSNNFKKPTFLNKFSKSFLRKLLFFSLVLITAIFSPPDIYSQLFLFLPLFLILESFILLVFIFRESPYSSLPNTTNQ